MIDQCRKEFEKWSEDADWEAFASCSQNHVAEKAYQAGWQARQGDDTDIIKSDKSLRNDDKPFSYIGTRYDQRASSDNRLKIATDALQMVSSRCTPEAQLVVDKALSQIQRQANNAE